MLDYWKGILVLSSVSVNLQSTSRGYVLSWFLEFMQVPILQNKFQFPNFQLSHSRYVVCHEAVSPLFQSHIARNVLPTVQGEPAVAKLSSFLLQIFQLFDKSGRGCFTFREVYTQLDIILLFFFPPKSVAINIKNLVPSLWYFFQARLCYERETFTETDFVVCVNMFSL